MIAGAGGGGVTLFFSLQVIEFVFAARLVRFIRPNKVLPRLCPIRPSSIVASGVLPHSYSCCAITVASRK